MVWTSGSAAGDDRLQTMREFVNEMADRLHLPPVFWEPPIDYRQDNLIEGDGRNVLDEQHPRARYLYGVALVASVAVHGALLAYAINYAYSPEPLSGVSPTSTAAISIELSDTSVVESLKSDGTNTAAQAAAASSKGGEPSQPAPQTAEKPEPIAPKTDAPPPAPAEAAKTAPAQPEPQQMEPLPSLRRLKPRPQNQPRPSQPKRSAAAKRRRCWPWM